MLYVLTASALTIIPVILSITLVRCNAYLEKTSLIRYEPCQFGANFPLASFGAGERALRPVDLLQSVLGAPFCCMHEPSFADKADQNRKPSIVSLLLMRVALVNFRPIQYLQFQPRQ